MKKLMIMMAAIATGAMAWAIGEPAPLNAQVTYTVPTDAEVGPTNIVGYSDNFQTPYTTTGANVHWWMPGFVIGTTEDPLTVAEIEVAGETEPTTAKVLQLESSAESPVLRTFTPVGTEGDYDAVTIDDHGTFVDTWVKLSASEGDLEAQTDDKIAVWLQVIEEDSENDIVAATNLVVTCGALDGQFNTTKTNVVLNADIEPDTWHRITIRAMKGIAASASYKNIGFLVYIDEQLVAAKEGAYLDFTGVELSTEAQKYATARQLFPSLQKEDEATLTAAGFAGVGQIASVNLDTQHSAPYFAKDKTFIRITWDEHVQSIVLGDGANMVTTPGVAGTNDIEIASFATTSPFVSPLQTLAIEYVNTFKCDSITPSANLASFHAEDDGSEVEFSLTEYESGQIDITSIIDRIEAVVTIDDGDPIPFTTLAAALADSRVIGASGRVVITLGEDVAELSGFAYLFDCSADEVVIDLAGNTILGTFDGELQPTDGPYVFISGCALTITDSVGGGQMIAPTKLGLIFNMGSLVLEAGNDVGITYTGAIVNEWVEMTPGTGDWSGGDVTILGGSFSEKVVSAEETMPDAGITLGTSANPLCWLEPETEEDYWTLTQKVAFTLVKPAHTTVQSIVDENGAEVTESDKIDPNAIYTVTITAESGYVWGEDETEKTETFVYATDAVEGVITLKTDAPHEEGAKVVSYTITGTDTAILVITNDGVPTQALTGDVEVGKILAITASAKPGYEYTGDEDHDGDWNFVDNAWTISVTAVENTPIEVTVPVATAVIDYIVSVKAGGADAVEFANVASALAAVQLAEGDAANFPIVVTALADGVVVNGPNSQTLTLNTDDVITITADGWTFAANITGNLVLEPGKSIIATAASASAITAPAGYMIVTSEVTGGVKYEAKEILATVQVGEAAAVNFCDLAAVLAAVQEAEAAEPFETIVVTAVGAARTFAMGEQSITLGKDETITIAEAGSWKFSNLFVGKVLLVAGNEIIAKGIADGSEILVDEDNGYELKTSGPVEEYYTYTAELKTLTATFYDDDAATVLYQDTAVVYGTVPEYKGETPAKTGYTFAGWNKEIVAITEDTSYVATYTANPATLTLPASATGVATMTVYQKAAGATDWAVVTAGESGAYSIAAGNFYKVAVTADTGYDLVGDGAIISEAAVEAGETITIEAADLAALVTLHNYTITYKNDDATLELSPATFTIAVAVELPATLGQLGGELEGWYTDAACTEGNEITGWAAGEKTADVTVYAKIEQVVDEPAEIVKDKVNVPDDATDEQKKAIHDNAQLIYTAKGSKAAAEAWITSVYGEGVKIPGAKLAEASAENVEIAMKYDIEIMKTPVVTFTTAATPTEGKAAAFTFQIKDGTAGDPISLEAAEAASKVLSMVQYCSTLGSWAAATDSDVAVSVDDDTAKVELVKKNGVAAGFMKVVLTPPAK